MSNQSMSDFKDAFTLERECGTELYGFIVDTCATHVAILSQMAKGNQPIDKAYIGLVVDLIVYQRTFARKHPLFFEQPNVKDES